MKLEDKIRAKLRDWVAEDELEAIIDTELNKARSELKSQVKRSLQKETERQVEEWFKAWKNSDKAKEHTEEIITELLSKARENILAGKDTTDSYGRRTTENIACKVQSAMVDALSCDVDDFIRDWRTSEGASEFKKKIAADLIPAAAGHALAQLAETVLSGKLNKIMHPNLVPAPDPNNRNGFGSTY